MTTPDPAREYAAVLAEHWDFYPEIVRDLFFEFADDGHLYCQGCVAAGLGVFL